MRTPFLAILRQFSISCWVFIFLIVGSINFLLPRNTLALTYSCTNTSGELDGTNPASVVAKLSINDTLILTRGKTCAGPLILRNKSGVTVKAADPNPNFYIDLPTIRAGLIPSSPTYAAVVISGNTGGNKIQHLKLLGAQQGLQFPTAGGLCTNQPYSDLHGVRVYTGSDGNIVEYLDISGFMSGITILSNGNTIRYNTIHDNTIMGRLDNTDPGNDFGAMGVDIGGNNNIVAYNEISNHSACSYDFVEDGSGVEIYNGNNNEIHHNRGFNNVTFSEVGRDPSGTADSNKYYYNLVVGEHYPSSPILANEQHYSFLTISSPTINNIFYSVTQTTAFNNTVYLKGYTQGFYCKQCNDIGSAPLLTFYNNIVAIDPAGYESIPTSGPGEPSRMGDFQGTTNNNLNQFYSHYHHNLFYCPTCPSLWVPTNIVAIPISAQSGNTTNPPNFGSINNTKPLASDFHLTVTSTAAINAGVITTAAGDLDNLPIPLPHGGIRATDMGAFEFLETNYITNGSFEATSSYNPINTNDFVIAGWSLSRSNPTPLDETYGHLYRNQDFNFGHGLNTAKIYIQQLYSSEPWRVYFHQDQLALPDPGVYAVNLWARTSSGNSPRTITIALERDGWNNRDANGNPDGNYSPVTSPATCTLTNTWNFSGAFSGTIGCPVLIYNRPANPGFQYIRLNIQLGGYTGDVFIDKVQLYKKS